MLEIHSITFVVLIVLTLLLGFSAGLIMARGVIKPISDAMTKTNIEYRDQLKAHGNGWVALFELQKDEADQIRRQATLTDQRFFSLLRLVVGPQKSPRMQEVADQLMPPGYYGTNRKRSIPARTPQEEAYLARRRRFEQSMDKAITQGNMEKEQESA